MLSLMVKDDMDLQFDLVCQAEREIFKVPVNITGARGIVDFPNEVGDFTILTPPLVRTCLWSGHVYFS